MRFSVMEPEDGRLWVYDTADLQTVAFTPDGMEHLREYNRSSRGLERAAPVHRARWYFADAADAEAFRRAWLAREDYVVYS